MAPFAPLPKNVPLMPLPPWRGTTFITGPPVSASPIPPEVLKVTSCAVADIHDVERRAAAADRGAGRNAVELEASLAQAAAVHRRT